MQFAIGADLDEAVVSEIKAIPEKEWKPYKSAYIAETVHSMEKTEKPFRLIGLRRTYQSTFFAHEDPSVKWTVIATNRIESAEDVVT